jgi:hypothetical protein
MWFFFERALERITECAIHIRHYPSSSQIFLGLIITTTAEHVALFERRAPVCPLSLIQMEPESDS